MAHQYIGSTEWARKSNGSLSFKDRITLLKQSLVPTIVSLAKTNMHMGLGFEPTFDQVKIPDTAAVKSAMDELEGCATEAIIQHSLRTYFWGSALGLADKVAFEPEFLMVGCLFHDMGITATHHGKHENCNCFALEGAQVAAIWAKSFGWPEQKQILLAEMISLHLNGPVDISNGEEAHLLQIGAAYDVIGARFFDVGPNFRNAILAKHPRAGLNKELNEFFVKEATMRPNSRTALMRLVGIQLMLKMNPFSE